MSFQYQQGPLQQGPLRPTTQSRRTLFGSITRWVVIIIVAVLLAWAFDAFWMGDPGVPGDGVGRIG